MPDIKLFLQKSLEENASAYYDQAKKIRKKITGAQTALQNSEDRLAALLKKNTIFEKEAQKKDDHKARKKEWFEKLRWFISSDGFLVVGGRDATTNEIIIKKHLEPTDLVFHTDIAGSPFFVIKSQEKEIPEQTIKETAEATATFSRAWKLGLQSTDVFYVKPEQVTKQARPGEFLGKGAFMVYGKTNYVQNTINLAIGTTEEKKIMAGPLSAVQKHCKQFLVLKQGSEKASDIAKKIRHLLDKELELDDIIKTLPAGQFALVKTK